MTTTVTIAANQFTAAGPVPLLGRSVTFQPIPIDINSITDVILSEDKWSVPITAGAAETLIPDSHGGYGVKITSDILGWRIITVANYPVGTISLPDLVNNYSIDPETLEPIPAPDAWWTALNNLVNNSVAIANQYTDEQIVVAKDYTDDQIAGFDILGILPAAKDYTDDAVNTATIALQGYTDDALAAHLNTEYLNTADHGVTGDGTTDDSAAMNTLLTLAASLGLGVLVEAQATVRVVATPLTIPSGTRLNLNGATIKSALPATGSRLLLVANATDVVIQNGTLDGDKASFAPATEQRHNIHVTGSTNVVIRDLKTINAKGDGVYVGDQNGLSRRIYMQNVLADANWRQGLSISHVSGFVAINCQFTNTSGTAPMAGVDIEPNTATVACENIKFFGCTMSGCARFGFLVAMAAVPVAHHGDVMLVGCSIIGNGVAADTFGGGLRLVGARDFTMVGGDIKGNTGPGVLNDGTPLPDRLSTNVRFYGVTVEDSSLHGFSITQPIQNLTIDSCVVKNNGTAASVTYDGISLAPAVAMTAPTIVNTTSTGASQRYGILTNSLVSGLYLMLNSFAGNGTAEAQLGDAVDTRFRLDGGSNNIIGGRFFAYGPSGSSNPVVSVRQTGDTGDRVNMLADGRITLSSGAASADVILQRTAAGVWGVATGSGFKLPAGATGSRPSASAVGASVAWLDTTTHKLQISDGTAWRDSAGTVVP